MPFNASGVNAKFKMSEWAGPQGRNNVELVAGVSGTKIAINDIVVSSAATATRVRLHFRDSSGVNDKIHEFILAANTIQHVPFAGSVISEAGDSLVADYEEEEVHVLITYETTNT